MASFVNFEDETGESVTGLRITLESGIIIKGRSEKGEQYALEIA